MTETAVSEDNQYACGTSYATPIVAKTAAVLEHSIEGTVSRETLIGLLLHHAKMPAPLQSKAIRGVARDLVGFGKPPAAREILEGDDHQITLVFASRLRKDQQIAFNFAWPASLVGSDGACRGAARLTLISTPPLDPRFGSEFVRINIDAALQQEDFDKQGKLHWKRRLDPIYLPGKAEAPVVEVVVDFVGVLRELRKALQFDSSDVSGVIEDLDVLLADFQEKMATAVRDYLDAGEGGDPDERLERVVYGRFLELEARKAFFEAYKDIEALWEILSPSPELRDHIETYKHLAQLYAAVRNAYAEKVGFVADLAYKTKRLSAMRRWLLMNSSQPM